MPNCTLCGDTVYIGSRLPEDAYVDDGNGGYKHITCPREPGFVQNFNKGTADGRCGACGHKIPTDSLSRFYCSSTCAAEAREHFESLERDDDEEY